MTDVERLARGSGSNVPASVPPGRLLAMRVIVVGLFGLCSGFQLGCTPAAEPKPSRVDDVGVDGIAVDATEGQPGLASTSPLRSIHDTVDAAAVPESSPADPPAAESREAQSRPSAVGEHAASSAEPQTPAKEARTPVLKADDAAFRSDFATIGHDVFPADDARRWWTGMPGMAYQWGEDAVAGKRMARFHGTARLHLTWRDDTLLRMTIVDSASCELFFWRGKEGVSLRYYTSREPHVWAAYRTTRLDVPSNAVVREQLLSTDSGAFDRSLPGTFDLQVHGETLVLSRGGIPLLTAPLGGPPEEVVLEGHLRLRGMSVHRCAPAAWPEPDSPPIVLGGESVASLDWTTDRLTAESLHDGRVKFTNVAPDEPGLAFTRIPQAGLYEVIVRIDEADSGTGVFLGDSRGRPLAHLAVMRDRASQQRTMEFLAPGESGEALKHDVTQHPTPYFAPGQWVRLVAGLQTLHIWTSGDRRQWGRLLTHPIRDVPGAVRSVGVATQPGTGERSITLGHLEVRELSGLMSLSDAADRERAPNFSADELRDEASWLRRSRETLPDAVEPDRWLRACALKALASGPSKPLGAALVTRLLDEATPDADPQQAIAALRDAALLLDLWDESQVLPIAERLEAIGLRELERGAEQPSRRIRAEWLRWPLWTGASTRSALDRLANRELILAVARGDWALAVQLAQEIRFWNTPPLPGAPLSESAQGLDRLAQWVVLTAPEQGSPSPGGESPLPFAWRNPLMPQFNKDGYNLRAELGAALDGGAYDDACQLLMSLDRTGADGLLPDLRDPQLSVSLPTAILTTLRNDPEFAAAMNREPAQAGLIRVRQAIAGGDVEVLQGATVQFLGTPAAAEAHRWLGDREVAAGRFAAAEAHYRSALDSALAEQIEPLELRRRLAAAWSGTPMPSDRDPFPVGDVDLNGYRLSAEEYSSLLEEARARAAAEGNRPGQAEEERPGSIAPAVYRLERVAAFDGQPGNNAGRAEFHRQDAFGRQMAWSVDGDTVFVSNRFQITAYDRDTGQIRWAQGVGSDQGEAYDFPLTPMKPLVERDRVFVRRITRAGVELCAIRRSDGKLLWKQRPMMHVLTDPAIWCGELSALIGGKGDADELVVMSARFDRQSGAVLQSRPIAHFRDIWNQAIPCTWTAADRWAACQIGNVTAGLGLEGDVRWLRRPTWLPPQVDDLARDVRVSEPILIGDRAVVSVPGTRTVECLSLSTGRLEWRTPIADVRGIRGANSSRIVVDAGERLMGLDPANGAIVWRTTTGPLLEAWWMDGAAIVCARRGGNAPGEQRPVLVWLDAMTGDETAEFALEAEDRDAWQLGPMFPVGQKWWLLGGTGWKDHRRDLFELRRN